MWRRNTGGDLGNKAKRENRITEIKIKYNHIYINKVSANISSFLCPSDIILRWPSFLKFDKIKEQSEAQSGAHTFLPYLKLDTIVLFLSNLFIVKWG